MKISLLTLVLSIALILTCNKDDFPKHASIEEMNQLVLEEMTRSGIPSLVAGIVKEDQLVWQNMYGNHDQDKQESPTDETVYVLASISKVFTAVAVMQLYERGQLDLYADINNYLPFEIRNPNFPEEIINTRMLLTHTAGIAWPTNEEDPDFNTPYTGNTAPAIYPWIKEYLTPEGSKFLPVTWKNTAPGEAYQYTNIGGALLGYLVESISGQDFATYCQENIFQPLEMFNSGFRLKDIDSTKLATLYHDGQIMEQYSVPHYPASMLRSSLSELSHFLIAIANGGMYNNKRILKEETVEEMLQEKIASKGVSFIWQDHDQGWIGHTGGYWGVSSCLDLNLEHKVGVILFTNTYGKETLYPEGRIYEILHFEASRYMN